MAGLQTGAFALRLFPHVIPNPFALFANGVRDLLFAFPPFSQCSGRGLSRAPLPFLSSRPKRRDRGDVSVTLGSMGQNEIR